MVITRLGLWGIAGQDFRIFTAGLRAAAQDETPPLFGVGLRKAARLRPLSQGSTSDLK